uniref:Uncharacterized protein n=1 Tax=Siphoviridae sp. ctxfQ4 TaxID=2826521 RepID=A0A8S5N5J0_9CAUD|nr:MAG TPA: hypothetical protein [Siphoviridae sp. ctxfQ4]
MDLFENDHFLHTLIQAVPSQRSNEIPVELNTI